MICENPYSESYQQTCYRCGLCGEFEAKVSGQAKADKSPVNEGIRPVASEIMPVCAPESPKAEESTPYDLAWKNHKK